MASEDHGVECPRPGLAWREDAKAISSNFLKQNLKLDIPVREIDCAHRVGAVRNGKQTMLVKFFRRDYVEDIIKERRILKKKPYSIHEDATLENMKLLNRLFNHDEIDQSWLIRGTVWAKTNTGQKFRVEILDDINKKISDAKRVVNTCDV